MKKEDRKIIEEIISGLKCDKNFECAESGFEILCKAKDIGMDNYLECLESIPQSCRFTISFGNSFFCQCPIRVYVAKSLKR
jgi:hypothetical protein